MPLKAYEEFVAEPLAFPIGGKTYQPPVIGARTGVTLTRILAGDTSAVRDDTKSLWALVLGCTPECRPHEPECPDDCTEHEGACGSVYDQMMADDVPLDALARAGFAMLVDWQNNRETAVRVWESGIDPEAQAAIAAASRKILHSTPEDEATTTPQPASGTGTTTTKTARNRPAKKSAGSRSSRSGH